jgi:radical SAM protein with 4Fe4S-binding SPASM domain
MKALRIVVGPDGNPWIVTADHAICRWNGAKWQTMPGRAQDISVGADGSIWAIGVAGRSSENNAPIWRWNGRDWDPAADTSAPSVPSQKPGREQIFLNREFQEVVMPLWAEINHLYTRFILRDPTPDEVARHISIFCQKFPIPEERQQAVRAGNIRPHLGIRPLTLEIDVTSQCNLRCIFCHFTDERVSKQKREDISVEDFKRIADQIFPLCKIVNLSCAAEPLLHHHVGELLAITKSYGVPEIGMTSNGLLFTEKTIEEVVTGGMTHLVISIDGATKATYERIRKRGNFDKLIRIIRDINVAKERHGSRTPLLMFNFVMMRSNVEEFPAMVQLAHDLNVGGVTAIHLSPTEGFHLEHETMNRDPELCNRMLDEARALAAKYQIQLAVPANFDHHELAVPVVQLGVSALPEARSLSNGSAEGANSLTPVAHEQVSDGVLHNGTTEAGEVAVSTALDESGADVSTGPDHPTVAIPMLQTGISPLDLETTAAPVTVESRPLDAGVTEPRARDDRSIYNFSLWGSDDHSHCLFPWTFLIIGWWGDVLPCGWFNGEEPMGNIRQQSFEEIWNGPRYQKLRAEHQSGNLRHCCANCPAAGMGNVNRDSAFRNRSIE